MSEHIEREATCKECVHYDVCYYIEHYGREIETDKPCKQFKSADVVEVVHGEWIEETFESIIPVEIDMFGNVTMKTYTINKCSLCGRKEHDKELYCNCGAKMDGGIK